MVPKNKKLKVRFSQLKEYDPLKNLLNAGKLKAAIIECLIENDTEGLLEIIEGYLYAVGNLHS
jgi:hypothetical protein